MIEFLQEKKSEIDICCLAERDLGRVENILSIEF